MTVQVIVNGASGKMGLLACETIENHPEFTLLAKLSSKDCLSTAIQELHPKIVIDLTRADCVYSNALAIINAGVHPVIGTSGLQKKEIDHLQQIAKEKKLGGIIAPNFSISAILMMHFAAKAAHYLPDVEIIEAHHLQKFDAPSGTAIKTAAMIEQARTDNIEKTHPQTDSSKARGEIHHGVPIHSLRLPGVVASQQVIFGSRGETLTIAQNSIDRTCFMPGIVLCCQKVLGLTSLYYGMDELLGLSAE